VFRSLTVLPLPLLLASVARLRPLRDFIVQRASTVLSAVGALCGMTGTALLAAHPGQTTAVFALYSGSAAAWMTVGYLTRQRWLLASNVAYLMLALKGLMF
jgi:hypothetical protein